MISLLLLVETYALVQQTLLFCTIGQPRRINNVLSVAECGSSASICVNKF